MTGSDSTNRVIVRDLGLVDYLPTWQAMQDFTATRGENTADEIWLLEHNPVYTQGHAGRPEHLLNTGDIPVVQVDRGGQVTYHGPGQIVVYLLLNLRRKKFGVRELVARMEQAVVELLAGYGVDAAARADAPGVYVNNAKIAALGLRVRKGCSFHGLAFNLDLDMEPFSRINPCGYTDVPVTRLIDLVDSPDRGDVKQSLTDILVRRLGFTGRVSATTLDK